ncbi:MAG: hypothetical protein HY270_15005 [Deltaproteobacteria bacterium]|nr:hypothetical protein [Deltaproteobacteria bacterium]
MKLVLQNSILGGGKRQWALKPVDIAVALKLAVLPEGEKFTYAILAELLHLSASEAHAAVTRLVTARLAVDHGDPRWIRPVNSTLVGLLIYGVPYVFPAVRGGLTIGVPTAYAVPPLRQQVLFSDQNPPVWPHPEGTVRGLSLLPLHANLPLAVAKDQKFYELLALVDALRIGQAREREVAANHLRERLK